MYDNISFNNFYINILFMIFKDRLKKFQFSIHLHNFRIMNCMYIELDFYVEIKN